MSENSSVHDTRKIHYDEAEKPKLHH